MQKVITVTAYTNVASPAHKVVEHEYPEMAKYLDDGYKIKEMLPITTSGTTTTYSITFVLEKGN